MSNIITTVIYYRKPTAAEIADGVPKSRKIYITVPVKDVFIGVTDTCAAVFKPTIKGADGLRYYYECVNFSEGLVL